MVLFRRALLFLAIFAAGVAASWLVLPSFITPEEAEAVREPPVPEPITASVDIGQLREILVLEGDVQPVVDIPIAPWEPLAASRAVVTFLPEPGSQVRSGQPIVGLSERPLIFVSRMENLYRDLHRGLTGSDVENLQRVLLDLGYLDDTRDVDGVFGAGTEEAVATWYEDIGFPPAPPPEEITTLSVLEAENTVDQARQALSDARATGNSTSVNTARRSLVIAQAQLDALQQAPVLTVPASEILGLSHEVLVVEGSSYERGDVVDGQDPLVRLRTPETLVVAAATRAQTSRLTTGQPVVVMLAGREVVATVGEVVTAEPESSTDVFLRIYADVGAVSPGTPVTVEVELAATADEVVSVPLSAIRTDADGRSYVIVVDEGGQMDVDVEPGVTIGGRTEIISGLSGDELIVVG